MTYRIGKAPRGGRRTSDQPGPGKYNVDSGHSGPSITIATKPKTSSHNDILMPGPGNYELNSKAQYKNPTAFTMGAKYDSNRLEDPEPGPGTYSSHGAGTHKGVKIGKANRSGMDSSSNNLGPGQYFNNRPSSAGPRYGFSHQTKSQGTLDMRPGPGHY